jgi:hypothetical protein
MWFSINIQVDGAAFEGDPSPELARILREMATRFENGEGAQLVILDVNGNTVGSSGFRNKLPKFSR